MKNIFHSILKNSLVFLLFSSILFFSSCVTLTNKYKDRLEDEDGFWYIYHNTDLSFQTNYNSDYDIEITEEKWKNVDLPKSIKKTIKPILKKGGELLYWGKANTSPFFYSFSIVYPNIPKNSEQILPTQDFEKTVVKLNEQEVNRYTYRTGAFNTIEYHVPMENEWMSVFFTVDEEAGFTEDDFIFTKSKEELLLHEASSLFENWYKIGAKLTEGPPSSPFVFAEDSFNEEANYLSPVLNLKSQEKYYNDIGFFDFYCQALATYQSFAGSLDSAQYYFDTRFEKYIKPNSDTLASNFFQEIDPVNAKDYILERCENEQVVMFNEAHHSPNHRVFLNSLLPALYEQGFRYLALEALNSEDTLLVNRGYPVLNSGFYTKEPAFGNLIRNALSLGFYIIPYDMEFDCQNTSSDPSFCFSKRDSLQAVEINRIIEKDPKAKLIVLAGYQHIEEKSRTKWITMAQYFKKLTNINPLTIDQTKMIGKSEPKYENIYYRTLSDHLAIQQPIILANANKPWQTPNSVNYYDLQVIHPRITPENEEVKRIDLPEINTIRDFPVIVQLFITEEWNKEGFQAIPIANKIIYSDEIKNMQLRQNVDNATIIIRDKTGQIIQKKQRKI